MKFSIAGQTCNQDGDKTRSLSILQEEERWREMISY